MFIHRSIVTSFRFCIYLFSFLLSTTSVVQILLRSPSLTKKSVGLREAGVKQESCGVYIYIIYILYKCIYYIQQWFKYYKTMSSWFYDIGIYWNHCLNKQNVYINVYIIYIIYMHYRSCSIMSCVCQAIHPVCDLL